MGEAMQVTVVIPTHDRLSLLPEAMASALDQVGVQVRVIVVDDASQDGTAAWLGEQQDPRLTYVRLDPGRERTAARNAGLAATTTPLVLFLDDDDLLAPGALRALAEGLARHADAPVAVGTYATFGTYGPDEVPRQQPTVRRLACRQIYREVLWGWYVLPGAALWRTHALRALGGWDERRSFAEDMELSLRVHPARVALVPAVVLRYRQHGRTVDPSIQATQEQMNADVRAAFVGGLQGRDQRRARAVVAARGVFGEGVRAYGTGRYGSAVRFLGAGLLRVPALAVSPVLGPTLLGMVAKSLLGVVLPPGWRQRLRSTRSAQRAERYGARPG